MARNRDNKVRKIPHVVGFVWPDRARTHNKPVNSGGKSVCKHCKQPKVRVSPPKNGDVNRFPRTVRSGCKGHPSTQHEYATELV